MSLATKHKGSLGVELAMSQDSRFSRLLALVALSAGLFGCSPLPIGSESNSKSSAIIGERLSGSQNAPMPSTASAFASTQNAPSPAPTSAVASTVMPSMASAARSQAVSPSQRVASAAPDSPVIEAAPTTGVAASQDFAAPPTRFAASRDSAGFADDGDYTISSQDILQVAVFQVPDLTRTV